MALAQTRKVEHTKHAPGSNARELKRASNKHRRVERLIIIRRELNK